MYWGVHWLTLFSTIKRTDMPFTPLHMGPGILIKAFLRRYFSLVVFGWIQILIDLQPLWVMVTGKGQLHGFSHTLAGATCIAVLAGLTGKALASHALKILKEERYLPVTTLSVWMGAFVGTYSHILLDSIMHSDVQFAWPLATGNALEGLISIDQLHIVCVASALVGGVIFYTAQYLDKLRNG